VLCKDKGILFDLKLAGSREKPLTDILQKVSKMYFSQAITTVSTLLSSLPQFSEFGVCLAQNNTAQEQP